MSCISYWCMRLLCISCRRFLFFAFLFFVSIVSHQCCYSNFYFSIHLLSFVPYTWNDLSHRRPALMDRQPTTTVMWFSLAYSAYCIVVVNNFFLLSNCRIESNWIEKSIRQRESNRIEFFSPESECSSVQQTQNCSPLHSRVFDNSNLHIFVIIFSH